MHGARCLVVVGALLVALRGLLGFIMTSSIMTYDLVERCPRMSRGVLWWKVFCI